MASMKKQEMEWQAQDDAHTLARYQEIINDRSRMQRAVKVAKQEAANLTKRASMMQKASTTGKKK